ncbi:MAG: 4Fe-4S binding protein [Anaerolineae bacterium]|nr:4Fe-4S binding protein [Anaerolineae bacterium]
MPRINTRLCSGCGECIAQCPTAALGWKDGKAALLHPDKCIYCVACEDVCPVGAIELPYLVLKVTDLQKEDTCKTNPSVQR